MVIISFLLNQKYFSENSLLFSVTFVGLSRAFLKSSAMYKRKERKGREEDRQLQFSLIDVVRGPQNQLL
jgi:hypothetical protein